MTAKGRLLSVTAEPDFQLGHLQCLTGRSAGFGQDQYSTSLSSRSSTYMKPDFHEIAGLWECDGSLRDIYVQDTEAVHWNRFDQLLGQYECSYTFDGVAAPFPGSLIALENREGSHFLSILLGGPVELCCHFFIAEQLELDISPRDVASQFEHEEVLSFVENLADALELSADITPENAEQMPFLTYLPQNKMWRIHDEPW